MNDSFNFCFPQAAAVKLFFANRCVRALENMEMPLKRGVADLSRHSLALAILCYVCFSFVSSYES